MKRNTSKDGTTLRIPPDSDYQQDFFIPTLYDVGTRDSLNVMDVALFRLSKREVRESKRIYYKLPDGFVEVSSGPAGMATIWDYDIVLMATSYLTDAMNKYKEGKGDFPGRVFKPHITDILKFCRRADGGKQKSSILEALIRLNTTHVAIERKKKASGQIYIISEGEPLISRYRLITNESTGRPESVEIEVANWIYEEVTSGNNPDVLTVHPDYFLIDPGIARFIYRLARKAAGKEEATWAFRTIHERSGSTSNINKFTFNLRKLISENKLPEYDLEEVEGSNGPILLMSYRAYGAKMNGLSPQEYREKLINCGLTPVKASEEASKYARNLRQSKDSK